MTPNDNEVRWEIGRVKSSGWAVLLVYWHHHLSDHCGHAFLGPYSDILEAHLGLTFRDTIEIHT
jgi:hypothetical protein